MYLSTHGISNKGVTTLKIHLYEGIYMFGISNHTCLKMFLDCWKNNNILNLLNRDTFFFFFLCVNKTIVYTLLLIL